MENLIKEMLEVTKKYKYSIERFEITKTGIDLPIFLELALSEDCQRGDSNGDS